ncbi:MAG TPA: hypothetical protein VHE81_12150 [Lacipirellulaceae bacterium]|nr:hypothetical protein [Lacipirellulaceae bacterium]
MQVTKETAAAEQDQFAWTTQPAAARWLTRTIGALAERNAVIAQLAEELRKLTGTRLVDWIDHLALSDADSMGLIGELADIGYSQPGLEEQGVWRHPLGMFPAVIVGGTRTRMALRCDSVDDCLSALPQKLGLPRVDSDGITGRRGGTFRHVAIDHHPDAELWLVERHGYTRFGAPVDSPDEIAAAARHLDAFRQRQRHFPNFEAGFRHASDLFAAAADEIGVDWACDLFFAAEREYWQSRNRAGRIQYERQNRLGLGWANHDHHTFRSSRAAFQDLIAMLEQMGFQCRERFYAGHEAGWGAQVIEQPQARITIFADVDLSPEEVAGDFAHERLAERDHLGTVGLWCALHGEAFLEAGMHHLECQFDFDAAREQLAKEGVETMAPFTNFPYLKQAFTKGEMWPVDPRRVEHLLAAGRITSDQADRFRREGALGSHLEILERNDGYKGFNQTGISEIITRTDPRRVFGA